MRAKTRSYFMNPGFKIKPNLTLTPSV